MLRQPFQTATFFEQEEQELLFFRLKLGEHR
jgi:hypothetical protein